MSRVPVGRLSAVAAVVAGVFVLLTTTGGPRFREVAPGVDFTIMRGDPYCRRGSSDIAVLRVDPERATFAVRHYAREKTDRPLSLVEWQRLTRATAVFNAGQYYPDFSYMGLLVCGGQAVSTRPHPQFEAVFVASPRATAGDKDGEGGRRRAARIIDMRHEPFDTRRPGWREVAQSFMLFDRTGAIRTRRSTQVANRTVVAEDRQGRILVITTEGAYTLWELAGLLKEWPLQLTHAMSMDGGLEASMCVVTDELRYASFGKWPDEDETPEASHVRLPAVITVKAK